MFSKTAAPAIEGLRSEFIDVKGTRLHFWIGGDPDGQPAILWHGFPSTGYAWRKVAPALVAAGLCVLAPDMRGFGDSDKPAGTQGYDARALAEECRALVAQIGFGRGAPLVHAGHDMGAPPGLIWAADHPEEVRGLVYIEAPVMLDDEIRKLIAFTPGVLENSMMSWWVLALARQAPERLIVGSERAFLSWLYDLPQKTPTSVEAEAVDEYLRTFSGTEGVLGSLGVFRATAATIEQTAPLLENRVTAPIFALGGKQGLGHRVGEMISRVAENVTAYTLADCGRFMPEECPDAVVKRVLSLVALRKS